MYRATQLDLDRQVALKVFEEGYLERGGALERFRREAIAAGRLEHPRIVPVYDAGEIAGRAFMSMRLIPGDSLAERIARTGALAPDDALRVLSDMAEAIDFAHARGTVHRDVKPANILLDTDGTAFLSDFGLVRLDDMPGLTRRGDWLGTAEYVSPEQVEGEPATAESDRYSLAVVAFEALTGRAPFVRREASAVLLAQVRDPVPDASVIAPTLPTAVDDALAAGMSKDPAARPHSARELVEDLRQALGSATLRPTVVGAAAPLAGEDPWQEALGRFVPEDGSTPEPERPTQAFGDAARRRAMALGRDVAIAAAVAATLLVAAAGVGGWMLGASSADASGAEARGFEAGVAEGRSTGFTEGERQGRRAGKLEGLAQGRNEGRRAGLRVGREAGEEAGRAEGFASGVSEGRSTALDGLSPGSWYIVRVGSDEAGAVVASSSPVVADASQCYAVSGDTVLAGSC